MLNGFVTPEVRVSNAAGTVWCSSLSTVSGLKYASEWGFTNPQEGGDWDASWSMPGLPLNYTHPVLERGASVQILVGAQVVWSGLLAEPDRSQWAFTATGLVREATRYPCLVQSSGGPPPVVQTSTTPNNVLDWCITQGLPWTRLGDFVSYKTGTAPVANGSVSYVPSDTTVKLNSLDLLLDAVALQNGYRWSVETTTGNVTCNADPTTPTWHIVPGAAIMGTADDKYVSDIYGRYVSGTSNGLSTGTPNAWGVAYVGDDPTRARYGRKSQMIDLTALGLMSLTQATTILQKKLNLVGGRMGFTSPITPGWFQILNNGVPAPFWLPRGGDMMRVHGILNTNGNLAYGSSTDVVISRSEVDIDAGTLTLTPLGMVSRDLTTILADAVAPIPGAVTSPVGP